MIHGMIINTRIIEFGSVRGMCSTEKLKRKHAWHVRFEKAYRQLYFCICFCRDGLQQIILIAQLRGDKHHDILDMWRLVRE